VCIDSRTPTRAASTEQGV